MSDPSHFDEKARRLTQELRASAARVGRRRPMPSFGAPDSDHRDRHFAVEVVVALVVATAVVAFILALPRQKSPGPAGPTAPVISAPATPTPTQISSVHSTVTSTSPLVLYPTETFPDGSITLTARMYSGQSAGRLVIPPSNNGYDIAPDGSKVLDDDQIIAVSGRALGTISGDFPQLPIWADDSAHLCGISVSGGAEATGTVVVIDATGRVRTIATLRPISIATSGWQMLACSPASDRAIVAQVSGPATSLLVVQLSSGRVIAQHAAGDAWWESPVASHDGGLVAVNGPTGVTIRNSITWAVLGRVVRWGSQAAAPLIGAAVQFSWDGSRIIIDGGGAGGGFHPEWAVDWRTGRTVATNTGAQPALRGIDDAIPLPAGSALFLPPGDATADPTAAFLLESNGHLEKLPG